MFNSIGFELELVKYRKRYSETEIVNFNEIHGLFWKFVKGPILKFGKFSNKVGFGKIYERLKGFKRLR